MVVKIRVESHRPTPCRSMHVRQNTWASYYKWWKKRWIKDAGRMMTVSPDRHHRHDRGSVSASARQRHDHAPRPVPPSALPAGRPVAHGCARAGMGLPSASPCAMTWYSTAGTVRWRANGQASRSGGRPRPARRRPGRLAGRDELESPATPHGREPAGAGRGEVGELGRGARTTADSGKGRLPRPNGEGAPIGAVSQKAAAELMKGSRRST